uniref:Protein farnesyltransferase/geranylgeranyltransferase type-1 subunit alpha n=1 Tax=Tetraselmis sp. GSL018 TaxID=582737 RepID=A0A061RT46_9CHLO|mmetsp:Transcript_25611/g.60927  ORF Transcript_25611/g.60927 Transcript_25611/m.60927 type:complete len:325 (+) Transcript_25611:375-1349(+)
MVDGDLGAPLLLSKRGEWAGVEPLPLFDGVPVAAPRLSAEYADMLGLLGAVQASGERSKRVLDLTEALIYVNSANYTAWDLRWKCLCQLVEDGDTDAFEREMEFMEDIAASNAKNYQLWNHRRKCALAIGPDARETELEFTAAVLEDDAKNYHAWSHRQAIVRAHGLWDEEDAFTLELIGRDVYNNSAWNERMVVMEHRSALCGDPAALRAKEAAGVVSEAVLLAPNNPAPYNYLRGLYARLGPKQPLCADDNAIKVAEAALSKDPAAVPAVELLADFYSDLSMDGAQNTDAAQQAAALFSMLKTSDPIRARYWQHRQAELVLE